MGAIRSTNIRFSNFFSCYIHARRIVLAGQQRLTVLKVNENYSSQIPSCCSVDLRDQTNIPPAALRLQSYRNLWAVKQCPHCHKIWQRDVNACRYLNWYLNLRNIGIIFQSLQLTDRRPGIYGPAREGEDIVLNVRQSETAVL